MASNFFAELRRRNVYKVAVAYAVVGWLLVQIATQVFPFLEIPNWVVRLVIAIVAIGFPIALVIAWAFELTPEGLKRTEDVDPAQKPRRTHAWIYIVLIGAAISIGLFFAGRYTAGSGSSDNKDAIATNEIKTAERVTTIPEKSIAVLPFENLSSDKENAYFADGIQDEILTRLAGIADLKVISRTSTEKYKSKPDDLRTVSQQLGVAKVLEGTVQRAADKVRVNVQLIDARADTHLWAKSYDREVEDIFAVESEVSQEVADALQARLSSAEADKLTAAPTDNTEAYDLFLKGEFEEREAETSLKPEVYDQAANFYRQAFELDPKFALAIARLVNNRLQRHWFVEGLSEAELQEVKLMAERALQLAPTLAEAHVAMGIYYYFGHRQYNEAQAEFRRAIELQPNNERAVEYSSYVYRRIGQWEKCLSGLSKSEKQSPLDATIPGNFGTTYGQLRMWKEAEHYGRRALDLNPHTIDGMRTLLTACLNGRGDIKEARRLLETFPSDANLIADAGHATVEGLVGWRAYVSLLEKSFPAALQMFDPGADGAGARVRLSARAMIHVLSGNAANARAETQEARRLVETRLRERPNELDAIIQLSWIHLALDNKTDAVKFAQKATDLLPPEKDALVGTYTLYNLAAVKARTHDATGAIDILKRLLAMPAGQEVTIVALKVSPIWDPIRNDPGFQQLLSRGELVGPNK